MASGFTWPAGFKIGGACVGWYVDSTNQSLEVAAGVGIISAISFSWGVWDLLDNMKIYRAGALPSSAASMQYEASVKKAIGATAFVLSLIIAASIYAAFSYKGLYQHSVKKMHFVKFHAFTLPTQIVTATINGALIREFYEQDRAMLVCRLPDLTVEQMDDVNIYKSTAYDVRSADFSMQLDVSRAATDRILCHLTLLPKGTSPDQIKSLRQLKNLGGEVLHEFANGANLAF